MSKEENFEGWYEDTPMTQDWVCNDALLKGKEYKSWARCAWNHQQKKIDSLEAIIAEKDKEIERHAKTKAGVSWASYEVRSKQVIDLEKQLESAREIIGHYVEMDIYTYGAMAREWLKQNGGESE